MHVENWDKESEVIVVGYGLAGAISAIAAHDAGAMVLLLEKQERPGGNSILSGGAMIVTTAVKEVAKYLPECVVEGIAAGENAAREHSLVS